MNQSFKPVQVEYSMENIFSGLEIFKPESAIPICSAMLQFLRLWSKTIESEETSNWWWEVDSVHFYMYEDRIEVGAFRVRVVFKRNVLQENSYIGMNFSGKLLPSGMIVFSSNAHGVVTTN